MLHPQLPLWKQGLLYFHLYDPAHGLLMGPRHEIPRHFLLPWFHRKHHHHRCHRILRDIQHGSERLH